MKRMSQQGNMNVLLIPFILLTLFFIGAASFGAWAFMGRQDFKNNVEPKIEAAVAVATQETASQKDKEFLEKEKQPFKTYNGPSAYGSVSMQYPKTWSGYLASGANSGEPVDLYLQPGIVQANTGRGIVYALRLQVVNQSYDITLQSLSGQSTAGGFTSQPYALPKVPNQVGLRVQGKVDQFENVDMVVLPLRDKTLKIWTEGNDYRNDFSNSVLPNISFSP